MSNIWMDVNVALSEVPVNVLALIDNTDFVTREEAVVYNQAGLDLVWNFITTAGVHTQTAVIPTLAGLYDWTNQGKAIYSIEIPATGGASINNDSEGFGWFTGIATGVLPWTGPIITFRAAGLNTLLINNPFSSTRGLAGTALPAAVANAAGGVLVSAGGALDMDGRLDAAVSTRSVFDYTVHQTIVGANNDKEGYSLAATGFDLIASTATGAVALAKAVWDRVVSKANHDIANSAGKLVRESASLVQVTGSVTDATPTVNNFDTDMTEIDGYWEDAVMIFINGSANGGLGIPISGFLNLNGNMSFIAPDDWPVIPINGDEFIIYAMHVHPVSQIAEGVRIEMESVGNILADLRAGILFGAAATGTLTTTEATTDLTGFTANQIRNRALVVTSGVANGEARNITAFDAAGGKLTFLAMSIAMADGDTFKIV